MSRKISLPDLYYSVQDNYNMAVSTGRNSFREQAKKEYAEYKKRGGKRKFPTSYKR